MAGTKEFNVDIDVTGGIKMNTPPNNTGVVLLYNSSSRSITTRTNAQFITDFNLALKSELPVYTSSLGITKVGNDFRPTYGTTANTIAQGNDSRINNGQTAFEWGRGLRVDGNGIAVSNTISGISVNDFRNTSAWAGGTATDKFRNTNGQTINFSSIGGYGLTISARDKRVGFKTEENSVHSDWFEFYHTGNLTKLSDLQNDLDIPSINGLVPYIGATANVNLGTRSITSTGGFIGNASTATRLANIITTFTGTYPLTVNVNGVIYSHAGLTYTGSTGALAANTFIGALTGNATTATTLATARTINGTSFNGSSNITTALWGTSRNITIGNTTKAVNGSANVSWSLAEIGAVSSTSLGNYLPLSGGTLYNTVFDLLQIKRNHATNGSAITFSNNTVNSGIRIGFGGIAGFLVEKEGSTTGVGDLLKIDLSTKVATFGGQINTPSHGNSSQWKQAYDWGNFRDYGLGTGGNAISDFDTQYQGSMGYTYSSTINQPAGLGYGSLFKFGSTSSFTQLFGAYTQSNRLFFRHQRNGVYYPLVEIWHEGNFNPSGYVPTSRTITAGNGLSGGGTLAANRTITLGTPSAITLTSTNSVTSTSHTHAFNPGGTTAQYIRGDGSLATYANTTYALITQTAITAGTETTGRLISAKLLTDNYTPLSRSISTGTGLTGGGNLTTNRTFSIGAGVTPLTSTSLSTSDLNTIVTPGYYHQTSNANATTARNYPNAMAGSLQVLTSAGIQQIYRNYNTNITWRRDNYGGTWSTWVRVNPNTTYSLATNAELASITSATARLISGQRLNAWATTKGFLTSVPTMTATVEGTAKLFSATVQSVASTAVSATASRTYGIQKNSAGQLVVNVPWSNTTYSLASNAELASTTNNTPRLISGLRINTLATTKGWDILEATTQGGVQMRHWYSIANKPSAMALGKGASATRINALAMMTGATADGIWSLALGVNAQTLKPRSSTIGPNSFNNAPDSSILGVGLVNNQYGATVLGTYNLPVTIEPNDNYVDSSPLLIVGNGKDSMFRSNSLVHFRDGSTKWSGRQYYDSTTRQESWFNDDNTLVDVKYLKANGGGLPSTLPNLSPEQGVGDILGGQSYGTNLKPGTVVYLTTSGTWVTAEGNSTSFAGRFGHTYGLTLGNKKILLRGYYRGFYSASNRGYALALRGEPASSTTPIVPTAPTSLTYNDIFLGTVLNNAGMLFFNPK